MCTCTLAYLYTSIEVVDSRHFLGLHQMANNRKGNTITVPLGEDLFIRVNKVAEARKQSTAEFVRELLDAKTRKVQAAIDEIKRQEGIIQKEYDSDDENGQGTIRRSSPPDAGKPTAENVRDKGSKKGRTKT
jgi:hypothetical protein